MAFQFIPLQYLQRPFSTQTPDNTSIPFLANFSYPAGVYPTNVPNTSSNMIGNNVVSNTIANWIPNPYLYECNIEVPTNNYCGFLQTNPYNALLGYFNQIQDITPDCVTSYDPPDPVTFQSASCPVNQVCVPNFAYNLDQLNEQPYKCVSNAGYSYVNFGMTYNNFIDYFAYNSNSANPEIFTFKPATFQNTLQTSENLNTTTKKTFGNSTLWIVISIIIAVIIIIGFAFTIYIINKNKTYNPRSIYVS